MKESYTIKRISKRDGTIVLFEEKKIVAAIVKAMQAVDQQDEKLAQDISKRVIAVLNIFFKSGNVPHVEAVQDLIEKTLIEQNLPDVAKAYILYRKQHQDIRDTKSYLTDAEHVMDGYLDQVDWRVNENSNVNYSYSGLHLHVAGSVIANYTLHKIYPKEVADAHTEGDFHIHDLSMGIAGYCAGWSLRQLLEEGFNGVLGKTEATPPKHLGSALWQMINFIGTLQNEWAGAQAFSSFDTYLAPFVKADNLSYDEVKQHMQGFIFNMNIPSRWGTQTPFSNITFDWVVPQDMKDKKAIVGGKRMPFTYGDCQKEMDVINKAFIEVMEKGDAKGRIFTFPIPTYNITKDFNWDSDNATLLFDMTAKYGIPYFQNFVNSSLDPSDVRSMCCRLQMDLRELKARGGGLFGSAEMTGSLGVVTINLPRIGYLSTSEDEFFARIETLMHIAKESLEIKRKIVNKHLENGLLPFSKRYLGTLNNHFNTIGIVGMNEAIRNFTKDRENITTTYGQDFAVKVLDFMRDVLSEFQEETGNLYNLEATPAEGTSYRLARIDIKKYPDIIHAGDNEAYYTNSSQLPVGFTEDVFEALDLQDKLQSRYTGGTVLHGFIGEKIDNAEVVKKLLKKVTSNYKLPYFSVTPTFSICPDHGYIAGEHFSCPHCSKACEVFSRVVGYLRPVTQWNKGKKEEFEHRKEYSLSTSLASKRPLAVSSGEVGSTLVLETVSKDPVLEGAESKTDIDKEIVETTLGTKEDSL
ncbi:MAG: ribonucleoside triphosphate reductase [Candidatus Woesearchaeota archaeon]